MTTLLFFAHGQARGQCFLPVPTVVCEGSTITLTPVTTGGTWSSSSTAIATVTTDGIVTGVSAGTVDISYDPGTSPICSQTLTVNPVPSPISGPSTLCLGNTANYTDATTGGTWSASGTATVNPATGVVTPISAGTAVITYSLGTGCNATKIITVETTPVISGSHTICPSSTTALTVDIGGGTWTSGGLVTVSTTGVVTSGTTTGSTTISYTITGCSVATFTMTVEPTPTLTVNPVAQIYCSGSSTPVTVNATAGGSGGYVYTWSPAINLSATTGATVMVSGTFTPCTDNIYSVMVTDLYGCQKTVTTNIVVPCGSICDAPCYPVVQLLAYSSTGGTGYLSADVLDGKYYIDNNVTINANISFNNAIVAVRPGVTINVAVGKAVDIESSHFYSCSSNAMWGGFHMLCNCSVGSSKMILTNSLIEDALIGVNFDNPCSTSTNLLSSVKSIFNRNWRGLYVNTFASTAPIASYPITLQGTIFTSRLFDGYSTSATLTYPCAWPGPVTDLMLPWTAPSTVNLPMNIDNPTGMPLSGGTATTSYAQVSCKASGVNPAVGILLGNVGPTNDPTYSGFPVTGISSTVGYSPLLFDNLGCGINGINSNLTVNGCFFAHIKSTYGSGDGIFSNYSGTPSGANFALNVNNSGSGGTPFTDANANYFYNCSTAVEAKDMNVVNTNGNYIYSDQPTTAGTGNTGILVHNGWYGISTFTYGINYNYISNVLTGINYNNINDAYSGSIYIGYNKIAAFADYAAGSTNLGINASTSSSSTSGTGMVGIKMNEVYQANNGISVSGFHSRIPNIYMNHIMLHNPGTGYQTGINYADCYNTNVYSNYVTGEATSDNILANMYAYSCGTGNNAITKCNNAKNTGRGFNFNGYLNPHTWIDNNMENSGYGLYLYNTALGPQGDDFAPSDNTWSVSFPSYYGDTKVVSCTAVNSKLFVRDVSGTTYWPYTNLGSPILATYGYATTSLAVSSSITTTYPDCYTHDVTTWRTTGGGTDSIISNSPVPVYEFGVTQKTVSINELSYRIDSVPDLPARINWISQMSVYQAIVADTSYLNSSTILQTFASLAANSRYARLTAIGNSINANDFVTAQSMLVSLDAYMNTTSDSAVGITMADGATANAIIANYVAYYNLLMKYKQDTLSTEDSSILISLGSMCPLTDGSIIYEAQSLYNTIFGVMPPHNDCGEDTSRSLRKSPNHSNYDAAADPLQNYSLYPNPTSGNITIQQAVNDNQTVSITIYDAMGSKVKTIDLQFASFYQQIILNNLSPGLYLVHLTNSKNRNFNLKFIIE